MKTWLLVCLALCLPSLACCTSPQEERMRRIGPVITALRGLTGQVQTCLDQSPGLPDEGKVADLAGPCQWGPGHLDSFKGFEVLYQRQGHLVVVLLCDQETGKAALEDVFCDSEINAKHYQMAEPPDCGFTINAIQICDK